MTPRRKAAPAPDHAPAARPAPGPGGGLIEGHVDLVVRGLVLGWARGPDPGRPCRVAVTLDGVVLGEALADCFRRDLLQAGIGHGHYAFAARLRTPLPRGGHALRLRGQDGETLDGSMTGGVIDAPAPEVPPPLTVEDLLSRGDRWRAEDVLGRLDCLAPAANLERMGPARFVDCCYRFVLARWPGPHEAEPPVAALAEGSLDAETLLRTMLASPERAGMDAPPASPYDADFPFLPG